MKREMWHEMSFSNGWGGQIMVAWITYIVNNRVAFVFKEIDTFGGMSLTNCMEKVLEQFMNNGMGATPNTDMDWYHWCPDEGLFKLNVEQYDSGKLRTQDMKVIIEHVSWTYVSETMAGFDALYGPGL